LPVITPDGTRVVYLVPTTPGSYELHVAPLDGSSTPIVLAPSLRYQFLLASFRPFLITPDGTRVAFRAAPSGGGFRLHMVPLDGSRPPIRLTRPDESVLFDFRLTADGRMLVYRSGEYDISDTTGELFQVSIDGTRLPVRIGRGPTATVFDLDAEGTHVLHRTAQDDAGVIELYSSRLVDSPRVAPR
jgi:Tol biopolymer transport system component